MRKNQSRVSSATFSQCRIHRATLLNVDFVHELHAWFAGRMLVRLKDEKKTELGVSRDRVRALKERLGL